MKKEIYDKFNFDDDIEIMNLDYRMQNRQMNSQNEDYLYSLETKTQNQGIKQIKWN